MAPGRSLLLLAVLLSAVAEPARAQRALPESLGDVTPAERAKLDARLAALPVRVIVQLSGRGMQERVMRDLPAADFALAWRYESLPAVAGTVRSERALARLAARGEVVRVYPALELQWDLLGSVAQIGANARHAKGNLGAGVVVAVLDSGIDEDHPDLADSLVGEECFLSGGGCPGGGTRRSGPGAAADDVGHGTHVAGIVTSNGVISDGPGVAPAAGILAMKIGTASGIQTADWLAALDFLLAHPELGVRIVNMSFGTSLFSSGSDCDGVDPISGDALSALRAAGVIAFAASGNQALSGGIALPACLHAVVSVGSVGTSEAVSASTNTGPNLDLLAPGEQIDSTYLNGGHAALSGTSMASPHAAGCAALLLEAGEATNPDQLEARLEASAVRPVDPDNGLSFPRIDCSPAPPVTVFPYVH